MNVITYADNNNIFFLLMGVAYLAYSLYRKFQKSKQIPEDIEEQESGDYIPPAAPAKSWLEEVLLGEEFSQKVPDRQPVMETLRTDAGVNENPVEREPFLMDELQMYRGGEFATDEDKALALQAGPTIEVNQETHIEAVDFDLKKAVLYEALLHRPYA